VVGGGGPLFHPEYYYGFVGVAATLNVLYLLIARDPLRWHAAMLLGVCGKVSFAFPTWLLYVSGRAPLAVALFATVDLAWAAVFFVTWIGLRSLAVIEFVGKESLHSAGEVAFDDAGTDRFIEWALRSGPDRCTVTARVSIDISAPVHHVAALYADWPRWPELFAATILSLRPLKTEPDLAVLAINHVEGPVLNVLVRHSATDYELCEQKPRYFARFQNQFKPQERGTRYIVTANVTVHGPIRGFGPLLEPLVRRRLHRYLLEPLRDAAERSADTSNSSAGDGHTVVRRS